MMYKTVIFTALAFTLALPVAAAPVKADAKRSIRIDRPTATPIASTAMPATVAIWLFGSTDSSR